MPKETAFPPLDPPRGTAHPDDAMGPDAETYENLKRAVEYHCRFRRDAVAEVLQRAWVKLDGYRRRHPDKTTFNKAFLANLARFTFCDFVDQENAAPVAAGDAVNRRIEAGAQGTQALRAPNPQERAITKELGRAIQQCLGTLSPRQRDAVVLFLQGHTYGEVAAILDLGSMTIKGRINRGMSKLRRCLGKKGW